MSKHTTYTVGYNTPGCLPEMEPIEVEGLRATVDTVIGLVELCADEVEDPAHCQELDDLAAQIRREFDGRQLVDQGQECWWLAPQMGLAFWFQPAATPV